MDRFDWLEIDPGARGTASEEAVQRIRPHDGPSFYRAARRMRESGHFRAALSLYAEATGHDEHQYGAWVEWIDTLVRSRRVEEAEERSAYAVGNFRRVRPLYAARALTLAHQKRWEEADQYSAISLEGGEQSWYARCVRAELLLRKGVSPHAEPLRLLEEAAGEARSAWEVFFLGGWMLLDAERPALAAGYFAEAAHCHPRAPVAWLCLGDCFQLLRLYEQAMFYYQRVIELEAAHELALKRQKQCSPKMFGLMRVFHRQSLHDRWRKEFDRIKEGASSPDDF